MKSIRAALGVYIATIILATADAGEPSPEARAVGARLIEFTHALAYEDPELRATLANAPDANATREAREAHRAKLQAYYAKPVLITWNNYQLNDTQAGLADRLAAEQHKLIAEQDRISALAIPPLKAPELDLTYVGEQQKAAALEALKQRGVVLAALESALKARATGDCATMESALRQGRMAMTDRNWRISAAAEEFAFAYLGAPAPPPPAPPMPYSPGEAEARARTTLANIVADALRCPIVNGGPIEFKIRLEKDGSFAADAPVEIADRLRGLKPRLSIGSLGQERPVRLRYADGKVEVLD